MNGLRSYAWLGVILIGLAVASSGQVGHERCLVSMGMPSYPPLARQARITGEVKVQIEVSKDGDVLAATSAPEEGEAKGIPLLRPEAMKSARSWKFAPADFDQAVPMRTTVTFEFKIEGEEDTVSPTHCPRVTFQENRRVEIVVRAPVLEIDNVTVKPKP